jgi:hypothetical protein
MTMTQLRALAKTKGLRVKTHRSGAGHYVQALDETFFFFGPDATHPDKSVAIAMLAMGLRRMKARKR